MRYSQKNFQSIWKDKQLSLSVPYVDSVGETDLPYKSSEERENLDLDLDPVENEQENSEELEED